MQAKMTKTLIMESWLIFNNQTGQFWARWSWWQTSYYSINNWRFYYYWELQKYIVLSFTCTSSSLLLFSYSLHLSLTKSVSCAFFFSWGVCNAIWSWRPSRDLEQCNSWSKLYLCLITDFTLTVPLFSNMGDKMAKLWLGHCTMFF